MSRITYRQYSSVKEAAFDKRIVKDATHSFYRYPARFSPRFARAAIEAFTDPGEIVLDPFSGSGTTAVEALRSGRKCYGFDINELALLVSKVKCTLLSKHEIEYLRKWSKDFEKQMKINGQTTVSDEWLVGGYMKNLHDRDTWRNRDLIHAALSAIDTLSCDRLSNFTRCVLLRSAQQSLDCRRQIMPASEMRSKTIKYLLSMLADMESLVDEVNELPNHFTPFLTRCDAQQIHKEVNLLSNQPPKLILTSPPYPGIRVLYNKWQVRGRRETAAPYWIINKHGELSSNSYTLGSWRGDDNSNYFSKIKSAFQSLSVLCDKQTVVVQLMAFSDPDVQLQKYLDAIRGAGFTEVIYTINESQNGHFSERIWREVPNRKWYTRFQKKNGGAKEVVFIHKLS